MRYTTTNWVAGVKEPMVREISQSPKVTNYIKPLWFAHAMRIYETKAVKVDKGSDDSTSKLRLKIAGCRILECNYSE